MQHSQILATRPTMRGMLNGHRQSSYFSEAPPSPSSTGFGGSSKTTAARRSLHFSSGEKTTIIRDTALALKRKSNAELGHGIAETADHVSFIELVEYIHQERLSTLPHKGSKWDTCLIRALYLAERLHAFEAALNNHAHDIEHACKLGYGHIRLLLDLGHENSEALEKAFAFCYRLSSQVSQLVARAELLKLSASTYEQLSYMYTDLLSLVTDIAVTFYKAVHSSSSTVSVDIYEEFGDVIVTFRERREAVTNSIWRETTGEDVVDVAVLSRWLSPQDRVLTTLALDYSLLAEDLVGCVWFHDDLAKFIKGSEKILLINGNAGSGRTTLAASLTERLQRPIAKKQYATAFCSVGAATSQANTLYIVQVLLNQLLNLSVGNAHVYDSIAEAYEQSKHTSDPTRYEDLLWHALEDALRNPLAKGKDTVLVVDGIEEIAGGKSAGQALLQRLVRAVEQGKGVKIIGLAQSLALPSGSKARLYQIKTADTRDDMHEVVLRCLIDHPHFKAQTGREQETTVSQVITASNGSFLHATLVSELSKFEKTLENFAEAAGKLNPKTTDEDLLHTLIGHLGLSDDAKTLLSWLAHTARPLTIEEIGCLFAMDVAHAARNERRVHVHALAHKIAPLLTISEDIVSLRYKVATRNLLSSKKIALKEKTETDLLHRVLLYAKLTLPTKSEPSLECSDRSIIAHSFSHHPLLEYVIRHWTWHLQQATGIAPGKPSDIKVTTELQKCFPHSVTMPILENMCWDLQYPGSFEVQLHELAARIRSKILTEKHPATFQSWLNAAGYYLETDETKRACSLYYYVCTLSKEILSVNHPMTVSLLQLFLRISEGSCSGTTSRTEIITHREQILILLITAYERQFGARAEITIQIRQQLYELYIQIEEHEHAEAILIIIRDGHHHHHQPNGDREHDRDGHLHVNLRKKKHGGEIDTYDGDIFDDDIEEEENTRIIELTEITVIIRRIEVLISEKHFLQAELLYLSLWQRISITCRTTLLVEWHAKRIEIIMAYAKFLETHSRRTESISLLISITTEYCSHELAFAQIIVELLVKIARTLRHYGEYSASLTIYKHVCSYYKNVHVHKEESKTITEIEEEMVQVSEESVKHTHSETTTTTTHTATTSFAMFQLLITKKFDSSVMIIATQLISEFISTKSWSKAIEVIHITLERSWSSFFSQTITICERYREENIRMVEQLARCHLQLRDFVRVEEVYSKFFRATLTVIKEVALFERAKLLIIGFYTSRGHVHGIIQIHQEILAVYRLVYGVSHELTIALLYHLGSLCRTGGRTHYWLEYYQNICIVLNHDSKHCHPRAWEAAVIVAECYWEERRYNDCVTVYALLWSTFVHKHSHKEFKSFFTEIFIRSLYERYYSSLEETQCTIEVLYTVCKEYRETCKSFFGATSVISIEATIALARFCERIEKYSEHSLSLYQEALKIVTETKTTSTTIDVHEVKSSLTRIYRKRVISSSSTSISEETITQAIEIYQSHFHECYTKYGYSHETSLIALRELVQLWIRRGKTEVAVKELIRGTVEIIIKETSSQILFECASSLVQTFFACKLQAQLTTFVEELHYQLIVRQKTSKSTFSVIECKETSLFFLATIEWHIRKEISLTLSEFVAIITAEHVMYREFRSLVNNKASLDKILIAAAPLRYLLLQWKRTTLANTVEQEAIKIFVEREASSVQLLSKRSPQHFIVGILEYLGNRRSIDFVAVVIRACNKKLASLIKNSQFEEAHDIAKMCYSYASYRKGFRGAHGIGLGFKLASQLDGRGENCCQDKELRQKLLTLSNGIIKDVLKSCREQKISLTRIKLAELNELIALVGEQKDWDTLEGLLNELWSTREAQKSWDPKIMLRLGRLLICARYLAGRQIKSIRLAEDISYNMRRVNGARAPATIDAYDLLAQLYTSNGQSYQREAATDKSAASLAQDHFKKSLLVHEDILRWLLSESSDGTAAGSDDDDDDDFAASLLAEHGVQHHSHTNGDAAQEDGSTHARRGELVKRHLQLLKLDFQRHGGFPKEFASYERLNAELFRTFGEQLKGVEGVEKWSAKVHGGGKAESQEGVFANEGDWEILRPEWKGEIVY
ncbi:unnamed protein product [Zymoseptoria tritici ST99CH_3D7]|uniref:Nephrocystin 3-like N-terminal domain-containing protein n=1 Tax=Zymoseptoria tritici (strain ST99CH_3D7) TaxID=1276538 RepID=A0A1X7RK12_ZYMT9|nr:unnamed protein product [Zymoseptoria tritici ST99CH_3D7]